MSKIAAIVVLATLTFLPIGHSSCSSSAPKGLEVMVLFSGLMVFNKNPATGAYEVGMLLPEHTDHHQFCIRQDGVNTLCRNELPQGTKWQLTVKGSPAEEPMAAVKDKPRRPDHKEGQCDFDWTIPLDGTGFHEQGLMVVENQLKPIIQLPKVELFTMYKSPDFVRWQGGKPENPPPFGFVAETVAFRVYLEPGEYMVLEGEKEDGKEIKEIFKISYADAGPMGAYHRVISFSNTRYPPYKNSDFRYYYNVFRKRDGSEIPESEQYDFAENPNEPHKAYNPLPKFSYEPPGPPHDPSRTCCGLVCTAVRLEQWRQPLH